mmetsp:Transcript_27907/g.75323  ORF Transcript_27907/g.75323 Transcript_27907/m.75323 type:complete len:183 (-) Transcript_27907:151-699(-)
MPAAEGWGNQPLIFTKLSSVLYAVAQKGCMYEAFKATLGVQEVATPDEVADMTHYRRLLAAVPNHALGVPFILHCLLEQVAVSSLADDDQAQLASDESLDAIQALLDAAVDEAGSVPLTAARLAAEEGARLEAAKAAAAAAAGWAVMAAWAAAGCRDRGRRLRASRSLDRSPVLAASAAGSA